jgi:hypothetical protein
MANTVVISRSHLIYGVCLPLAILVGYMLAEPFESGSIAVVVLVLSVLSIPLFMRWHHPLLILSCNAAVYLYFFPGRPTLWMIMTAVSMFILMLNRSLGQDVRFFRARQVSYSLIFLALVVVATAYMTGGVGFAFFGARNAGGKRYLILLLGIMLYFGLSTIPISPKRRGIAVAAFFLMTLTGLVGYGAAIGGPGFNFLVELFPIEGAIDETSNAGPSLVGADITRFGGLANVALGVFCFVLARYGVKGVLDLRRPWRLLLLLIAVAMNLYSGFRSNMITFLLIFGLMFYLEGLFHSRYFPIMILAAVLMGAVMVPFAQKLPLVVQRSICFLPINVDPVVRRSAEDSTDWRLDMWKELLPTVPRYLIKGKGYVMDANDAYLMEQASKGGFSKSYDGAILSGDYHSGPLSTIIPFGLFGVFAFLWFLAASFKALRQNHLYGGPALQLVNTFMLAYFIVRVIVFLFIFGSLYSDMMFFASVVGMSVSLNGGVAEAAGLGRAPARTVQRLTAIAKN